ncbi:MAG: hypothetical protein PVJ47_05760, partial [Thiohalocapsa sp.]
GAPEHAVSRKAARGKPLSGVRVRAADGGKVCCAAATAAAGTRVIPAAHCLQGQAHGDNGTNGAHG